MRRIYHGGVIILFLAVTGQSPLSAGILDPEDLFESAAEAEPYIQANFAGAFTNLDSGGFNTVGFFPNTGGSDDEGVGFGGAIGLSKSCESFRVRTEIEGMWREDTDYVTNSFPGPPGPIAFFYQVEATNSWSVMSNLWLDMPLSDDLWMYAGGGIGVAGIHLNVNDSVVDGQTTDTNFACQAGTGFICPVGEKMELDLGYRILDGGETVVDLSPFAGKYKADMVSQQIMFCVRLDLY